MIRPLVAGLSLLTLCALVVTRDARAQKSGDSRFSVEFDLAGLHQSEVDLDNLGGTFEMDR